MCGSESQSFCFDRKTSITERRTCLSLQVDQRFRQTLISTDAHHFHVSDEIAVREEKFGGENLCSDFETSIQIRLIAVRNTEIAIAIEMFQFVGHGEGHWVTRQALRQHDSRAEMIVNKCATQMPESIRPLVNFDAVLGVDSPEVTWEHAW